MRLEVKVHPARAGGRVDPRYDRRLSALGSCQWRYTRGDTRLQRTPKTVRGDEEDRWPVRRALQTGTAYQAPLGLCYPRNTQGMLT